MSKDETPASHRVEVSGGVLGVTGDDASVTQNFYGSAPSAPQRVRVGRPPLEADAFQDRPGLRAQVSAAFESGATAVVSQSSIGPATQVVTGHGGVGKSQLAAQVWRDLTTSGGAVVDVAAWVTATSRTEIVTGYASAAAELGLDAPDPERAAARFLNWLLATDKSWLVILDDLADPGDARGLWPQGTVGRVLVTTRRRDPALFTRGRRRIDVDVFAREESIAYLTERLTGADRDVVTQVLSEDLDALAGDVSDLPIALAQASAFILNERIAVVAYRQRLAEARLSDVLVADDGDEHERAVAATLLLNLQRADQLDPGGAAGMLAQLIAVLDPNGIPEAALTSSAACAHANVAAGNEARRALLNLDRFSVITHDPASHTQTVRMHALTQRAIREQTPPSQRQDEPGAGRPSAGRVAGDALVQVWPAVERDAELGQALRANGIACWGNAGDALWHPGGHAVLWNLGNSLGEAGLVAQAVDHWARMCVESLRVLGPDHRDTLDARGALARWRGEAGDLAGAAAAFEELLTDFLRVFGPDHPRTLLTRGALVRWRGVAGDPAGAVAASEELLTDQLRVLGPDHPETLTVRNNLAAMRGQAGDPAGAAAAFEELLTDRLRVLGPDHPDTLTTRGNVAGWRGEAGDPAGAAAAFEELLTDRLRVLGAHHPNTLITRGNVARWRGVAGDPAGAAAAFEELLTDQLRILGPDHPDALITRNNLAAMRGRAGDPAGAAAAFEELLTDCLRVLGPDHPNILIVRSNLARWRGEASRAPDA
jgi:hypothetical protein